MQTYIDIKKLSDEELSGVINVYPWFSIARKEMCLRMADKGDWALATLGESTLYITDRRILASLVRLMKKSSRLVKADFAEDIVAMSESATEASAPSSAPRKGRVVVIGGDYFSKADYAEASDSNFSTLVKSLTHREPLTPVDSVALTDISFGDKDEFCTETLAQIYLEQGYIEQAKKIYLKLSLEYPEKSVYFASLIDNLNN